MNETEKQAYFFMEGSRGVMTTFQKVITETMKDDETLTKQEILEIINLVKNSWRLNNDSIGSETIGGSTD